MHEIHFVERMMQKEMQTLTMPVEVVTQKIEMHLWNVQWPAVAYYAMKLQSRCGDWRKSQWAFDHPKIFDFRNHIILTIENIRSTEQRSGQRKRLHDDRSNGHFTRNRAKSRKFALVICAAQSLWKAVTKKRSILK